MIVNFPEEKTKKLRSILKNIYSIKLFLYSKSKKIISRIKYELLKLEEDRNYAV